ncbi:aldo/keto reductase [Pseudonocardia xinjiangensis]|uniref:Aldo/keto reductase n=1 Tax=Pseudonocardia xinjiangensis TaxID=75289 RepID=A0ABX1R832_9PSEU|nr:aldo/keto reductase [Pseudonocardia xinjiangensis]NMH76528.1 aldo/keto reductase [Pseudonocardia xinjiangensis]
MTAVLGRSSVPVSPLGLGTAPLGNLYRVVPEPDVTATIDQAWESGIRFFDTAPHYGLGLAERRLGAALAGRPRAEYTISTKVGRLLVPDPDGASRRDDEGFDVPADLRRVWDFSADGVRRSLEGSLERLGLDRIDLVLIHDPDDHWAEAAGQAYPALHELRAQGVIGAIGAGMNQTAMLTRFVVETEVDAVLVAGRYTLLDPSAADDLLPACAERGVSVLAAGVFNSGLLATDNPPADATYDYQPAPATVRERAAAIGAVCRRHGVPLPAAAIAFAGARPEVASVVLGARAAAEVAANAAAAETRIPDALWADLTNEGLLP